MRGWASLVFAALLAAMIVALVVGNGESITVSLLFVEWPTKVWGALVAAAAFGAAAAALVGAWAVIRLKVQARRQIKRIAELEQEVHGLRTLPIAGESASSTSAQKV